MRITFPCPGCQSELEAEATAAGSQVACPKCGQSLTVPRREIGPGVTIGGFEIRKLIGKGGMGEVYLARQISLGRDVALKILPEQFSAQKGLVARFLKEVHLLAGLEHPNIVTAHEAGEDGGVLYLAMAYVGGDSLDKRLKRSGPLAESEALNIVAKVSSALDYAWSKHHLLHRDIKPGNILLTADGEVKLTDLGLAKSLDEVAELTLSGTIMGTPNYMSPEQVNGQTDLDCRADMYSLGATLYYLITGKLPFEGTSLTDTLRKQVSENLPDPRAFRPEITEGCVRLLELMLAKDRDQRHPDWKALLVDIQRVQAGQLPTQEPPQPGESVLLRIKALVDTPGKPQAGPKPVAAGKARSASAAPKGSRNLIIGIAAGVVVIGGVIALVLGLRSGSSDGSASHPVAAGTAAAIEEASRRDAATAEQPAAEKASRSDAATVKEEGRLTETPLQSEKGSATESLANQYADAIQFTRDQPANIAGALTRFEALTNAAAGTDYADKIAAEIKRLTAAQQAAVEKALTALKEKVAAAVSAGKYDDALKLLEDETGSLAGATAAARLEQAQAVREQKKAAEESQAQKTAADQREQATAEAQSKLDVLRQSVAESLLQADYGAALQRSLEARKDAALAPVSNDVSRLSEQVSQATMLPERLQASFEQEKGKVVNVEFKTGKTENLKIMGADSGKIQAQRQLAAGFIGRDFAIDDLSWREKLKRLGDDPRPALSVLRGLTAAQGGDLARAEKEFESAGEGLGVVLAQAVQARKTQNVGPLPARPPATLNAQLLRAGSATHSVAGGSERRPEDASRSDAATVKPAGADEASHRDAATSSMARKTVFAKAVKLKPATKKVVEDALAELKKANPGMTITPVYSIDQYGIKLDLSKEPSLKDLAPLAGLPLYALYIHQTEVSDLSPLTGMPLQSLQANRTGISDLSPLAGMPLESLYIPSTAVSDLSPLRGMKLRIIYLNQTPVTNIAVLAGMPIIVIHMNKTLVRDLTPLKGMQLRTLNIGACDRITDFSPIKNTLIEYLEVGGPNITNLKVFTGMKVQQLTIADPNRGITDLNNITDYFKGLKKVFYNGHEMTVDEFKRFVQQQQGNSK